MVAANTFPAFGDVDRTPRYRLLSRVIATLARETALNGSLETKNAALAFTFDFVIQKRFRKFRILK